VRYGNTRTLLLVVVLAGALTHSAIFNNVGKIGPREKKIGKMIAISGGDAKIGIDSGAILN